MSGIFSRLYTPEGQKAFREERQRKIDELTSMLARQLPPDKRTEIEVELAKVRATGLGYIPPTKPGPEMIGSFTKDQMLEILARQTEAGSALVTAGLVEDWLEKLLLAAGRELSNKDAERIFQGMGALSSFSAKIEITYLFHLIEKAVRNDLRVIKSIRNNFAHTTRFVNFGTEHIATDCRRLSTWNQGASNQQCYQDAAFDCIKAIKSKLDALMYANALKEEPTVGLSK
ncbi:hypothetical protein [Bradyrhizobium sp. BRP56]|uniref:hypothetical protein n=1 Tax=Bradyrhizobium sp. BRP56 TaxID=2793819 RepID=UPI001CD7CA76|nr:hypothetical protein [Bradyrhizobium sp. BRP56]MCA1399359.1 hypothetical protein [Bradyrhizobium sp. BRP56]